MSCGIYKFENNVNHMVYIGQAIDLEERYKKHIKNIRNPNHQEDIYIGLREYGLENFSYEILEQFDNFDQMLLNNLECYYIDFYNSLKPNGYNMIPGGTNGAGLAKGKKVLQYDLQGNLLAEYSSAIQASKATGINNSSISACCRNEILHTKQFQWKYYDSDKFIGDISNKKLIIFDKKIIQYSKKGEYINAYSSLKEATEITNISKSSICNACNKRTKTAGGFVWRYEGEELDINENFKSKTSEKPVLQFDKNGNFLQEFSSLSEASKQTNTHLGNIQAVCSGKRKTANKFIWKYKE